MSASGITYKYLIDPLLAPLHRGILPWLEPGSRVLDVACGTGTLALLMAGKAGHVTGIDLSESMVAEANRTKIRRGVENAGFLVRDAAHLSDFGDQTFDLAVTSMAIHQFPAALAVEILKEMKRIARQVIILDYHHPMPRGLTRSVIHLIEWMAGKEHNGHFRVFKELGGLEYFTEKAGLKIISEKHRGNGCFGMCLCKS